MKTEIPAAIVAAYDAIMQSAVFRTNGPPIDLAAALQNLGNAVADNETDEFTWSLGEFSECTLGDLIVGAYWCLTEWHGGQSSPEYAAMCALGRVFSPGRTSGPEPDSGEADAYDACDAYFAEMNR